MLKLHGFDKDVKTVSCVCGEDMVVWGPKVLHHNGADTRELTQIEIEARLGVYDFLESMKKTNPDLKNATLADSGCLMGIRQTRFIKGEYQITGDDVLSGARFDDVIAIASNPVIEYWAIAVSSSTRDMTFPIVVWFPRKWTGCWWRDGACPPTRSPTSPGAPWPMCCASARRRAPRRRWRRGRMCCPETWTFPRFRLS